MKPWTAGNRGTVLDLRDDTRVGEAKFEGSAWRHVQLRGAGDSLLISAEESQLDDAIETRYEPLTVDLIAACTDQELFFDSPMRVDFWAPGEPAAVGIFHAHRGVVPISADELFAIDVAAAVGDDTHHDEEVKILLRRVKPGG